MKQIKAFLLIITDIAFYKTIKELIFIWHIKKFRKIYTDINEFPLYNFSKCLKGEFEYLYKKKHKKYSKIYFQKKFQDLVFQLKYVDNEYIRMQADAVDYYAKWIRTGNKRWKNEFNTIKKQIEKYDKGKFDLTDFVYYIERTFKHAPGSIDPKKISTAYAFKLFNEAKEINKRNGNN